MTSLDREHADKLHPLPIGATTYVARSRAFTVALWLTQIAVAALFLFAGGSKLAGEPQMVQTFDLVSASGSAMSRVALKRSLPWRC